MWNEFGRFCKSLLTGDAAGAAEVLAQKPEGPGGTVTIADPKEDDPPCGRVVDGAKCAGHGIGGMCIFPAVKGGG